MTDGDAVLETIIPAGTLHDTLDILDALVGETVVNFGSHGITTGCIDPATVAMHNPLEVKPEAFEYVPDSGSYYFGVNLTRLDDYLSKASADTPVSFSFKPESRMLNIQYDGVNADMACIDPDTVRDAKETPELDLPNQFTIPSGMFADAIDIAGLASDHVEITCQPDSEEKVVFRGEGDTDDVTYGFEGEDIVDGQINEESTSLFSLEYLESITKAMPDSEVELRVGTEFPMFLNYEYASGNASVQTMIAPRISTS